MIWVTIGLLLVLLGLSLPVGVALGVLGLLLSLIYSPLPLSVALGELSWSTSNSFVLVAVPLYILLGEIVLRAGIAERVYNALVQWVTWLPGGLMHSNIAGCATFAAISGSSVATAVTVGTVALGEVKKHNYNERLFLGTLAAGGTLGILIPPSIVMIVYGVMTETSIPRLYLAGIIPGVVLAALFSLTVILICLWRPGYGGDPVRTSWAMRIRTLPDLLPPLLIFAIVIGAIYAGLATATESAALGVLAALALAAFQRTLTWKMLRQALEGTVRLTAAVMLIIIGAYFLNLAIGIIGFTSVINDYVTSLHLSPVALLTAVILFYLLLGTFMEELSMMVATVPVTTPLMIAAGFDPVWFGILIVILIETALISPPIGMNLFVVHSVRGRGQLNDVVIGSAVLANNDGASPRSREEMDALLERARLLEGVVNNFPGGISVFDKNLTMVYCNEQQKKLLEYPDELFEGGYPTLEDLYRLNAMRGEYGPGSVEDHVLARMMLAREQRAHVFERIRPNGMVIEVRGVPLSGGGFVTTYLDVTEQRKAQAMVAHLAHHDALTDLPNRALFRDRLDQALARVQRGEQFALHYLDLDRFKPVNDEHGHAVGDELLRAVALRLTETKRETDTIARFGGDEFVFIQTTIASRADATAFARRVLNGVRAPFSVGNRMISIGTSIGISMAPEHGLDADELLKQADAALYRCKVSGGGYGFAE